VEKHHQSKKVSFYFCLIFVAKKEGEEAKEAPTRKFDEGDVKEIIASCQSFDDDQLGYVDYLESIIRIAHAFPFNEEELADMVTFEMKVAYFIQKLDAKYGKLKDQFTTKMNSRTMDMQYQPRVVVDEDESDNDDL
jgi:predicted house-cleaning noncanonical NTP pyrophosphatase (MazG superfamily)